MPPPPSGVLTWYMDGPIDDVEEDTFEEEINDDEDMLDNPDDEEEEEEMSPMQIPNPFLGLSPQSITNAALALAAKANSNNAVSVAAVAELDEERKQRQQLLLGGKGPSYIDNDTPIFLIL